MAKVKAPLFGLGARGKLGGALVYFPWKGIDVVREYVIPTNPKTPLQKIQRGYLKAAVDKIHDVQAQAANPMTSTDQTAMALLAAALGKTMTWFNMACKLWLDCKRLADIPIIYSGGYCGATVRTGVILNATINEETASQLAAGKFYLGNTRTNLIHQYTATVAAGAFVNLPAEDMSAWVSVGDKIFWQFRPDAADPCEGADTGIYFFYAT